MAPATGAHATGPHAEGAEHAPNIGSAAAGALDEAIRSTFGSYVGLREQFSAAALAHFGSGWAWLVRDGDQLLIMTMPNQDNPLMTGTRADDAVLGLDVWEHAYDLKYENRRADYVKAWWNLFSWPEAARRFERALASHA